MVTLRLAFLSGDPQSYWHKVSTARGQRAPVLTMAKPRQAPGGLLHARPPQHALEARTAHRHLLRRALESIITSRPRPLRVLAGPQRLASQRERIVRLLNELCERARPRAAARRARAPRITALRSREPMHQGVTYLQNGSNSSHWWMRRGAPFLAGAQTEQFPADRAQPPRSGGSNSVEAPGIEPFDAIAGAALITLILRDSCSFWQRWTRVVPRRSRMDVGVG